MGPSTTKRIKVTELIIGDIIVEGRGLHAKLTEVRKLGVCPGALKGVGKTHVNSDWCFDNIAHVDIVDKDAEKERREYLAELRQAVKALAA